jgi:hypothetical protein
VAGGSGAAVAAGVRAAETSAVSANRTKRRRVILDMIAPEGKIWVRISEELEKRLWLIVQRFVMNHNRRRDKPIRDADLIAMMRRLIGRR